MTATTISSDLSSPTASHLLRGAALAVVIVLLALGAFALGRITADASATPAVTPATQVHVVTPVAQDPCLRVASADC